MNPKGAFELWKAGQKESGEERIAAQAERIATQLERIATQLERIEIAPRVSDRKQEINRDRFNRMAREAGIKNDCDGIWCTADEWTAFADRVAAIAKATGDGDSDE